jgi:proline iminopeptidase
MLAVPHAQLFTVELGDGPEVLVLLHGGPGASHDYLRPQLDALAAPGRLRLLYYDQRGGGRSPLDAGTPAGTASDHVADLDRVREELDLDRLRLVGYSWGGLLALLYAVEHPERVERLALISPAPATAAGRDVMRARLEAATRRPEVAALKASLDPADRHARFALAVAGYFHDPRRALELTPFLVKQRAEEAVWRSLGEYDLRARLSTITAPVLIAHGREDPIPLSTAEETARLTRAQLVVLDDCAHVPYVEAADRLFPALRAFFDQPVSASG